MINVQNLPVFDLQLGNFVLKNCQPVVRIAGKPETITWQSADQHHFSGSSTAGQWDFEITENSGRITLKFHGHLNKVVDQAEITLLEIPAIAANHLFVQGLRMGSCDLRPLDAAEDKPFESFYHCLLTSGAQSLMFSMPLMQKQPGHFTGNSCAGQVINFRAGYELKFFGGTELDFDPITLEVGNGFDLLDTWTSHNIEVKKEFPQAPQVGWNSWDYYRWTITEEEVLKNADFIAHDPVLSRYVKRIIVDDGWQYCYGEWEANSYFPHGMAYLARELTKMGFEPGLWFAPSIAEPHCRFSQLNPELLAMSAGGQPCLAYSCMKRFGMILDPTVPQVQEHLKNLFDRYAGMGYKYFKLDFLQSTLQAARFHDATVPRSEIVRKLVAPIYAGIAGRAQILGCNYPFLAGNKMVNAVRIGSDIHATWDCIKHNTVSVAARFWANRKLWINDPDFSLCRGVDTSADPNLNQLNPCWVYIAPEEKFNPFIENYRLGTATRNEIEVLLGVVIMTAGAMNFSDNMPRLNAAGLQLARRLVTARSGEAARPLDIFASALPSTWLQALHDGGTRLMLVNWEDAPQKREFKLSDYGFKSGEVVDFYAEQNVSLPLNGTTLTLPPHSCRILETR